MGNTDRRESYLRSRLIQRGYVIRIGLNQAYINDMFSDTKSQRMHLETCYS
jgi:hypothetical protein